MLLYTNDAWTMRDARLLLAGFALAPLLLRGRRREVWWAAALIFSGPLPVLFVSQRNFYAFYLPYLGVCLLCAAVLERLVRLAWPSGPVGPALAALTLALWLAPRPRSHDHRRPLHRSDPHQGPSSAFSGLGQVYCGLPLDAE
ncbi:MAG: hypothetical protein HY858_11415 [Candidatus Solibacter usitatus]|nr:hypothetical protein [Candidatus Solibacter usitatus]